MSKVLLVEGYGDKIFFTKLLEVISLDVKVKVLTPTETEAPKDGKIELIRKLPSNLKGSEYTHLAVVVDADYPPPMSNGMGYEGTIGQVSKKISDRGYDTEPEQIGNGLVFKHSGSLNPFGLLVMSNNLKDGMFEDWIKTAINNAEKPLFDIAIDAVKKLPQPTKFQSIHQSKAEIATWMAWQRKPADGFNSENKIQELLDFDSEPMKQLIEWLNHIYN